MEHAPGSAVEPRPAGDGQRAVTVAQSVLAEHGHGLAGLQIRGQRRVHPQVRGLGMGGQEQRTAGRPLDALHHLPGGVGMPIWIRPDEQQLVLHHSSGGPHRPQGAVAIAGARVPREHARGDHGRHLASLEIQHGDGVAVGGGQIVAAVDGEGAGPQLGHRLEIVDLLIRALIVGEQVDVAGLLDLGDELRVPGRAGDVGDPGLGMVVAAARSETPGRNQPEGLQRLAVQQNHLGWPEGTGHHVAALEAGVARGGDGPGLVADPHRGHPFRRRRVQIHHGQGAVPADHVEIAPGGRGRDAVGGAAHGHPGDQRAGGSVDQGDLSHVVQGHDEHVVQIVAVGRLVRAIRGGPVLPPAVADLVGVHVRGLWHRVLEKLGEQRDVLAGERIRGAPVGHALRGAVADHALDVFRAALAHELRGERIPRRALPEHTMTPGAAAVVQTPGTLELLHRHGRSFGGYVLHGAHLRQGAGAGSGLEWGRVVGQELQAHGGHFVRGERLREDLAVTPGGDHVAQRRGHRLVAEIAVGGHDAVESRAAHDEVARAAGEHGADGLLAILPGAGGFAQARVEVLDPAPVPLVAARAVAHVDIASLRCGGFPGDSAARGCAEQGGEQSDLQGRRQESGADVAHRNQPLRRRVHGPPRRSSWQGARARRRVKWVLHPAMLAACRCPTISRVCSTRVRIPTRAATFGWWRPTSPG